MTDTRFNRRTALIGGAAALTTLATPGILRAQDVDGARRNSSAFVTQNWQDHFDTLGKGAIVCDTASRAVHFWNSNGTDYRVYPSSVPMTDELTRTGYTSIVRKKVGPTWTPTANMKRRDPSLPDFMPAGPDNPLGTHAMYLTWPAYLIHGTHDTRKIGRKSSSGCIGLYNAKIQELFALTPVGTQVRVI
ncbi:L,D-transpeptidase [Roseovarius sp. Pro17]|uniref:L,D-transpeptidase n=1 Tax=Roseovarius sp. Pro17 TaxID=3108175 RepID=UPI002D77C131|nr:L,D-transpeptidase [Roseovarius sp. Pro17]